ncbi:Uncharacterised protein [Chlamydia trachomatis]|nr:Uncharacterised protein [Chlamydia trachomatis]
MNTTLALSTLYKNIKIDLNFSSSKEFKYFPNRDNLQYLITSLLFKSSMMMTMIIVIVLFFFFLNVLFLEMRLDNNNKDGLLHPKEI